MFVVHSLSQYLHASRDVHLKAAHHLLRYIKGQSGLGLLFSSTSSTQVQAYSDADWATCVDTRRSVTIYCIFIGDSLVAWSSKKQNTVSRSSVEAKYRAMAATISEVIWIQQLLRDFQVHVEKSVALFCDNQAASHIAANPTFHEWTKQLEIDLHFVRDHVQRGTLKILPIRTHE